MHIFCFKIGLDAHTVYCVRLSLIESQLKGGHKECVIGQDTIRDFMSDQMLYLFFFTSRCFLWHRRKQSQSFVNHIVWLSGFVNRGIWGILFCWPSALPSSWINPPEAPWQRGAGSRCSVTPSSGDHTAWAGREGHEAPGFRPVSAHSHPAEAPLSKASSPH